MSITHYVALIANLIFRLIILAAIIILFNKKKTIASAVMLITHGVNILVSLAATALWILTLNGSVSHSDYSSILRWMEFPGYLIRFMYATAFLFFALSITNLNVSTLTEGKTMSQNDMGKAIIGTKSYVGSAVLTFVLYYVGFYVVGLLCNLLFLSQAKETQRVSGNPPSGKGCLSFLLWTHLIIPIILIILFISGVFSL